VHAFGRTLRQAGDLRLLALPVGDGRERYCVAAGPTPLATFLSVARALACFEDLRAAGAAAEGEPEMGAVAELHGASASGNRPRGTGPPPPGPGILVIEDEPGIRELLTAVLEGAGYRVTPAESALGALARVRRLHPAAVVLDLGLPYVSGVHLLAALRADPDPAVRDVPVVVVSALTETLAPERRAQVSAVLTKPFAAAALVAAVRGAIGPA
jgi:CheY-like chemotaxis protein